MAAGHQFQNPQKFSAEQAQCIRSALDSVIASDAFAGSKRCQDFLKLVVEHTLAGDVDSLRERMIGVEMFGRRADYDTSNDAVVRVRATEVRKRLAQYYREADLTPSVRIELAPGSYAPEFYWPPPPRVEDEGAKTLAPPVASRLPRRTAVLLLVGAIIGIGVIAILGSEFGRKAQLGNAVQLSLGLPAGVTLHRHWHPFESIALSPDGQMLAFAATDASGQSSLWIRPLSSSEAQPIAQSEGALLPFWSPDSQFVGFRAGA